MDRNQNVDDILAEIKRRKSHEKAGGAQRGPSGESASVNPPRRRPPAPPPSAPEPDGGMTALFEPVRPAAHSSRPKSPAPPPPEASPHNPLDFEGHVRPITDKAKIRRDRYSVLDGPPVPEPPAPRRFDVAAPPPQSPKQVAPVIDFTSFHAPQEPDGDVYFVQGDESHTRVMPRLDLNRSREFQLEDIQKLDFSAVADPYDNYDYDYEDDYNSLDDILPSTPPVDMSEYNSLADRGAVSRDIARVRFWLVLRCLVTAGLSIVLFYLVLAGSNQSLSLPAPIWPEENPRLYLITLAAAGIVTALVNSSSVGGGIISLFKMRANSDTLAAFALLAAIGQCVAGAAHPEAIDTKDLGLYVCVAALAMLFNALGKTFTIRRIQANFRIIASDREKRAVLPVDSDGFCRQFVRDSSRRPTIAYTVKAGFFTDFLGLSYSDKYDVGINRGVAPACILGGALVAVLTYLLTGSSLTALSALTAILCVSATFSATFLESIPLGKLTRRLAPQGVMVSGNKAVEDFCDTRAVILREKDLYPEGHIQLHGIKAYSHGRIDEAILDAASVICSTDSALSPMFLQMIGSDKQLLKKVDNLVYENNMGISAWVNSRRVLIGNRQLMEGHGISLPQDSYGQKYAHHDADVLYLSNSGEVSAQFVISYHIDQALAAALDQLAAARRQLIIHSINPHITPHRVWELYGYPEELIEVMPASVHAAYKKMAAPRDTAIAGIAYTGGAAGMVSALTACMNTRASILAATVIQLAQIILGYGLVAFIAFMGAMPTLTVVQLTVYQLFWFAAIFIVQQVRST